MESKYVVLYVDDEKSNLRIFKDSFRRDFDILTAESAFDALDIVLERKVDVVITDQRMPGMTGVELLKVINDKFPSIPPNRLILSGYSKDSEINKAFEKYKLFKFITKPWNYEELKKSIIESVKHK